MPLAITCYKYVKYKKTKNFHLGFIAMEGGELDISLLTTGANIPFGRILSVYTSVTECFFSSENPDPKEVHNYLVERGVKISLRRIYELNHLKPAVKEEWFNENLLRSEIRTLRAKPQNDAITKDSSVITALDAVDDSTTNSSNVFDIANKLAIATGFKIKKGKNCPYVINLSSIKRSDARMATVSFALILAIPTFSCDRLPHSLVLEHAKSWPEPIIADTLEHLVVELARNIRIVPAWALTSGSRILHEKYIEPWIKRDYLLLAGLGN